MSDRQNPGHDAPKGDQSLVRRGRRVAAPPRARRRGLGQVAAAAGIIAFAALALVGPTGVSAWADSRQKLEHRETQLTELRAERDRIANRVELLDPENADPDLVGELLRNNLNVAHPDEIVVPRD
ncbi:FtsB family cell division protein [Croceicoccus marinus]|uniref:Septum formation initiator family protein n=1 Tax=Croceicoccus marinus TaxID=450378 RepID=A0A7G6VQC3_9SPHN|nr:septum formation initiator family protein [Croceicoccus marinus]QNE03938.1 septum formation initiator family protein [Croceicoccus marinus]